MKTPERQDRHKPHGHTFASFDSKANIATAETPSVARENAMTARSAVMTSLPEPKARAAGAENEAKISGKAD